MNDFIVTVDSFDQNLDKGLIEEDPFCVSVCVCVLRIPTISRWRK